MVVTEKCDIYSFGVVVLEALMGRHPGELVSLLDQNAMLIDILDPRLSPPADQMVMQDIVLASTIAFACLRSEPKSRPTKKHVSQEFTSGKKQISKPFPEISITELRNQDIYLVDSDSDSDIHMCISPKGQRSESDTAGDGINQEILRMLSESSSSRLVVMWGALFLYTFVAESELSAKEFEREALLNTSWWNNGVINNTSDHCNLSLGSNSLSANIPSEISTLSKLRYLNLDQNNLTGTVPPEIGSLQNLVSLDLSNNNLIGSVPSTIGGLINLEELDLSNNKLGGPIPIGISDCSMLQNMKLSNNSLSGSIPIEIGKLLKLSFIDLSYNFINGTIPSQLVSLPILIFLFLSHNNLSGVIPELFKPIRYLNLSYNDLEGEIPMSLQYST
ncbi:hypothetical protein LWI29_037574 [Acer saccharum]|uniref:non-specific serine/threonine protein kinase n=1 Tax=Acer saccharum TaxID=4024 RepID=A0AA39T382_ACESA|nr:hypothetical protein LWI29_037574 [Acer saccharum]